VHVDAIEQLPIEVIVACHAPAIRGDRIKTALGQASRAATKLPAWS
jgi:hypothetical protein